VDPLPGAADDHGVAVASGGLERCHISSSIGSSQRAQWSLDAVGRWCSAWRALDPGRPAALHLVDDTLARKTARGSAWRRCTTTRCCRRPASHFCSFGHVWVVLALWVPLPMAGPRVRVATAVPVYVGPSAGHQGCPGRPRKGTRQQAAEASARRSSAPDKLALARELLALVAGWADGRTVYAVVDSAYAARPLLEGRPATVHVLSRLRPDAALWARPGRRAGPVSAAPAQAGIAAHPQGDGGHRRRWDPLPLTLYGRQVTRWSSLHALWYGALRDQPVRIVLVAIPAADAAMRRSSARPHRRSSLHPHGLCAQMDH